MQRILVVSANSILEDIIYWLLEQDSRFRVVRYAYTDDTTLLEIMLSVSPDVVVVDDNTISAVHLLELLGSANLSMVSQIFSVHAEDNDVEIYERRRVTLTRSRDLLHLVRCSTILPESSAVQPGESGVERSQLKCDDFRKVNQ